MILILEGCPNYRVILYLGSYFWVAI